MKATDRHKLITRIKGLEGLTDNERSALLGLLRESKTYGLVWEDKHEAVEERLQEELPVLTEVRSRAILSDAPDAPNHILIEGDNLEALATLAYTHEGKIDVIYIDPPYNTGNKDFVYNDSYVDTVDTYRRILPKRKALSLNADPPWCIPTKADEAPGGLLATDNEAAKSIYEIAQKTQAENGRTSRASLHGGIIINDPAGTDSWLYSKGTIDNTDDLTGWAQFLPHNL